MPQPSVPTPSDHGPQLAVWEFAGLMLTYWCSARCAFCYVYGGPDRGGEMGVAQAIDLWRGLDRLAAAHGKQMRVHLAGGEPFGDWPRLAAVMRAARDADLSPVQKVETNAFWATTPDVTRTRLELLDALGMEILIVSADPFHQEFVPFERVRTLVEAARSVLGKGRLIVRWWEFFNDPTETRLLPPEERVAAYAAALARHPERLTGRAALRLSRLLPLHPPEAFEGQRCVNEVLGSRHVHVDAYGNVFPGVCGGVILANAGVEPIDEVWGRLAEEWPNHPVVQATTEGGSYELMRRVLPLGFEPRREGYASKCDLCMDVRQFLVDRELWPEFVGPHECYANQRDRREADRDAQFTTLTAQSRPCQ